LGEIRQEICRQRAPLNSTDKEALHKITAAIDDFAGLVTGDREHFWLKPHRVPERWPGASEGAPRPDAPTPSKPDEEPWG
jgi:hypothetical protein